MSVSPTPDGVIVKWAEGEFVFTDADFQDLETFKSAIEKKISWKKLVEGKPVSFRMSAQYNQFFLIFGKRGNLEDAVAAMHDVGVKRFGFAIHDGNYILVQTTGGSDLFPLTVVSGSWVETSQDSLSTLNSKKAC